MRLIDADTLKGALEMDGYKSPYVASLIDACPTVDAVPVVRGKWLEGWCSFPTCSVCKEMIATSASSYCPNCGAKMDGGAKK